LISLKFSIDFDHMTPDVLETFKVKRIKGQGHSMT